MLVARGASDHLPAQVRRVQVWLRLVHEAVISAARARADVTDERFTHPELVRARKSRNTAAGADRVTYSMLAHAGAAGEAALLALGNYSWLAGRLPTAWKAADIQPIPKTASWPS